MDTVRDSPAVLVAGAGQVGVYAARELAQRGAKVIAVDAEPAMGYFLRFGPRVDTELLAGDIRESDALLPLIRNNNIQYVIACAGLVGHDLSKIPEHDAWAVNVDGVRNLAEVAIASGTVRRIVYISSVAVYGEPPVPRIGEESPLAPYSEYGKTKAAAERLLLRYRAELEVRIVRSCGVYGPLRLGRGSQSARLIEKLVVNARRGNDIVIRTTQGASDEYLYVKDLARAVAMITLHSVQQDCYVFNVGSGIKTTCIELAAALQEAVPTARIKLELVDGEDSKVPALDIERLRQALGFTPEFSLVEGLRDYIVEAGF